jgi:hypothetical protein
VQALIARYAKLAATGDAIALVVDVAGRTVDHDWDKFAVGDAGLPETLPEVVGMSSSRLRLPQNASAWVDVESQVFADHTVMMTRKPIEHAIVPVD